MLCFLKSVMSSLARMYNLISMCITMCKHAIQ